MSKKVRDQGFHSSLLTLNLNGTTHRTLLVLVVIAALAIVGNLQGGTANAFDQDSMRGLLIGLGLFAAGFLVYDYVFVMLAARYPVSLGMDKLILFGIEGLFAVLVTMTGVLTWILSDTHIMPATLISSAALLAIVALGMLPLRWLLGTVAASRGWIPVTKKVSRKRR